VNDHDSNLFNLKMLKEALTEGVVNQISTDDGLGYDVIEATIHVELLMSLDYAIEEMGKSQSSEN